MTVGQETVAGPAAAPVHEFVTGRDPTPGIVSVSVNSDGSVRVWRRVRHAGQGGDAVVAETDRFLPWFLATSLDVLAPLGEGLRRGLPGAPYPDGALAA